MDDQRLREKVYPLMRRTFNLYLHYLKLGDDGRYHLPLAFSDEYGSAEDTNMNLALLRWGLQTLIACNDRLKLNDPLLPKWKETLAKAGGLPGGREDRHHDRQRHAIRQTAPALQSSVRDLSALRVERG